MDLPVVSAFTPIEEPASAVGIAPSPQDPSPAPDSEGEFFDTLVLELHAGAPPVEAPPIPLDALGSAGRQQSAAGGNPLPALPDATAEIPDLRLSEPTALIPAVAQFEGREQLPAPPGAAPPVVTPVPPFPALASPALSSPVPSSLVLSSPPAVTPGAVTSAHAAPHPPVSSSPGTPAVIPEAATPADAATGRLPLDGAPAVAVLPAPPPTLPGGSLEAFEERLRSSAAFDDTASGSQPPAFARASAQSPAAEPAFSVPTLARATLALPTGINQPAWGQALGERVVWLVTHDVQRAELTLNPPELGPLRIRVTVAGEAASVAFASEHGPVREAVESALPQLRQILTERGLSLTHVEVSPEGSGELWTRDGSDSPAERSSQGEGQDPDSVNDAAPAPVPIHRGLIDQYA